MAHLLAWLLFNCFVCGSMDKSIHRSSPCKGVWTDRYAVFDDKEFSYMLVSLSCILVYLGEVLIQWIEASWACRCSIHNFTHLVHFLYTFCITWPTGPFATFHQTNYWLELDISKSGVRKHCFIITIVCISTVLMTNTGYCYLVLLRVISSHAAMRGQFVVGCSLCSVFTCDVFTKAQVAWGDPTGKPKVFSVGLVCQGSQKRKSSYQVIYHIQEIWF